MIIFSSYENYIVMVMAVIFPLDFPCGETRLKLEDCCGGCDELEECQVGSLFKPTMMGEFLIVHGDIT